MHMAPYFTALGLLAVFLSLKVVSLRKQHRVSIGHGGNGELERAVRVHGNFMEYAPLGLLMLIGLEFVQSPIWFMHLCGMMLLLGRILHVVGLSKSHLQYRTAGMVLTLLSILMASVGVLVFSILLPVI